jgi:two-component system cell cycle response regulator
VLVLLAEISALTRRRLAVALRRDVHDVLEADGAARALELCRERRPDVLVASLALCERDGVDLVGEVKHDVAAFRTAVVLVAPPSLSAATARAELSRGAQDFLIEPVREAELIARVRAAGRTKILQEELAAQSKRYEDELFDDPLTRVRNRRFLLSQLEASVSGARRHGRPLAVAMIDIDRFKAVNDSHGHEIGDRVLVAAGESLGRALRTEDVLGRLGGEEFLALLPDAGEEAAAQAAERLRSAVAEAGGPVPVTASVGWAVLNEGEESDDVIRRADTALYAAKSAGRDRVRGPATLPRRR